MFTAILGTRALVNFVYGGRRVDSLSIGPLPKRDARDAEEAQA
jgi:preprotein translocase subunit SecD